jgi:hypothetical protein
MSHCKCCDIPLTARETKIKKDDGSEEDLCVICLGIAYNPEFCDAKTYQFEDICEQFYIPEEYKE